MEYKLWENICQLHDHTEIWSVEEKHVMICLAFDAMELQCLVLSNSAEQSVQHIKMQSC